MSFWRKSILRTWLEIVCSLLFWALAAHAQTNTWIPQTSGTSVWLHDVSFVSGTTGWVVGDGGTILKSTSSGVSWSPQPSGSSITLTGINFLDADNGLACGGKGFAGLVLKTTNGGATWTGVDSSTSLTSIDFVTPSIAWAAGPGGIIKSTNGGSTWARQPLPDSTSIYTSLMFFNADTGWIVGVSNGSGVLFKTTNGGAGWTPLTSGIHAYDYIDGISFLDASHGWMSGYTVPDTVGYGMIKRTTDGGATWTDSPLTTDQELYSIGFSSLTEGWACGSSGTLLHSTDGGATWIDESIISTSLDKIFIRPGAGGWMVGLNGMILRNDFGGLSQQITASVSTGWNMICLPLSVADSRKSSLYPAAASNAFRYDPLSGYIVADTLEVGTGYWVKFSAPQDIAYDGSGVESISLDLLAGWNLVGGISSDVPVSHIQQNPPGSIVNVYAYNATGYYADTLIRKGQAYWIKLSQNCTLTISSSVPANVSRAMLTDVSKFRTDEQPPPPPGTVVAGEQQAEAPPREYALGQNYPNPFNPTTNISFALPEPSTVRLIVYDLLGRQVTTLVDGPKGAGRWTVQWNMENHDGSALAAGLYFYRLEAQSEGSGKHFTELKKMLLIK